MTLIEQSSKKPLKSISITERWDEFGDEEENLTKLHYFVVDVTDHEHEEGTAESFPTREEAEAYAAEVVKRRLKPFNLGTILSDPR